ncbi:TPA: GNAT family N-acetyltransferase [Citrobacter farmeri]|nr:GNAT family N-acetyltransferase [Citrobacter farmeri]HEM8560264.1 GNAT family N-acetyltransferase [Citrobacter farmeri]
MDSRVTVRKGEVSDLDTLCNLYSEFYAFNAELQPHFYVSVRESGAYPCEELNNDSAAIFIAYIDNIGVGFIHIREESTPPYPSVANHQFGSIVDVFVRENYRNRGVGGLMISYAKEWATGRGLRYLELMVLHNNYEAIRFYEKIFFKPSSTTMKHFLDDDFQ